MNKAYWENRYRQLKERGVVGQMSYNDELKDKITAFWNEIKDCLPDIKVNKLIDYGCGTGKLTRFLVEKYSPKKYIGIDLIDFVLEDNKEKFRDMPNVDFSLGTDEKSVNLIWSSFALQHFNDEEFLKTLKYFKSILAVTGKAIIINCIDLGSNTDIMFFRDIQKHGEFFEKAKLNHVVLKTVKVNGANVAVFEVSK